MVFGVWALIAGLLLVRQCISIASAATLAHRAMPVEGNAAKLTLRQLAAEFGVSQPRLRARRRIPTAIRVGVFRPIILLPCDHAEWDGDRLRATLAHELAHAARHDVAWQLLARLARCAYWFHPLAWLAAWRMRVEREVACDDWVLRAEHRPAEYARLLVGFAASPAERRIAALGGAVTMLGGRDLRQRLAAVLEARRPRLPISRRASKSLSIVTIGILLAVATLRPVAAVQKAANNPTSTAPEAQPARAIAGRVIGPDGKGVAGATVWHVAGNPALVPMVAARVRTDSDGGFRIPIDPGFKEDYTNVVAQAQGLGLGGNTVRVGDASDVALTPLATMRVTVVVPDGAPLVGCRITPRCLVGSRMDSSWGGPLPPEVGRGLSATTDEQCVCEITGLPRNARVSLQAEDDRFSLCDFTDAVKTSSDGSIATGALRLQPACSISGRVSFPDGAPAAGITMLAQALSGQQTGSAGAAVTDARGEYHIRRLKAATYNVALELEGQYERDWAAVALQELRVAPGQDVANANLAIVHGAILTGRVLKEDTGTPVPHVRVAVYGPARPRSSAMVQGTITDVQGRYTLRVPAGQQYVYFQGIPPEGYLRPQPEGQEPMVREGQTVDIDFKLARDPNPTLTGRVVGDDGRPAAGAMVTAELPDAPPPENSRGAKADADGRFRIQGVPAGARVRARLPHQATTQPVVVRAGETYVVLTLSEVTPASVRVPVIDAAGGPIPDATVELGVWQGQFGAGMETARTNREGRCTFTQLAPGESYFVSAEADGYGRSSANFHVERGAKLIEVKPLKLARADQEISGQVVDSDGKGVAGVPVEINGVETGHHTATTDRGGAFRFNVVPGARSLLFLRGSDGNPLPEHAARSGDTNVRIKYEGQRSTPQLTTTRVASDNVINGRVRDEARRPLKGVIVQTNFGAACTARSAIPGGGSPWTCRTTKERATGTCGRTAPMAGFRRCFCRVPRNHRHAITICNSRSVPRGSLMSVPWTNRASRWRTRGWRSAPITCWWERRRPARTAGRCCACRRMRRSCMFSLSRPGRRSITLPSGVRARCRAIRTGCGRTSADRSDLR